MPRSCVKQIWKPLTAYSTYISCAIFRQSQFVGIHDYCSLPAITCLSCTAHGESKAYRGILAYPRCPGPRCSAGTRMEIAPRPSKPLQLLLSITVNPRKWASLTVPVTILITGRFRNSQGQISQEVTSLLVRILKLELCRPVRETLSSIRLLLPCLGYLSSVDPVVSQMSPIQRNMISTGCHLT